VIYYGQEPPGWIPPIPGSLEYEFWHLTKKYCPYPVRYVDGAFWVYLSAQAFKAEARVGRLGNSWRTFFGQTIPIRYKTLKGSEHLGSGYPEHER
jgi:hypothetical protein